MKAWIECKPNQLSYELKCPECGFSYSPDSSSYNFCPKCGEKLVKKHKSRENDIKRKKDIMDWIDKAIMAYHNKSYEDFHSSFKGYRDEIDVLRTVLNHIYWMKPAFIDNENKES